MTLSGDSSGSIPILYLRQNQDHHYQYISRFLDNKHVNCAEISVEYVNKIFERLSAQGQTTMLMMDQSHINDTNDVLMLSVRFGERALPVAGRVYETRGNTGFKVQKHLLTAFVRALIFNMRPVSY